MWCASGNKGDSIAIRNSEIVAIAGYEVAATLESTPGHFWPKAGHSAKADSDRACPDLAEPKTASVEIGRHRAQVGLGQLWPGIGQAHPSLGRVWAARQLRSIIRHFWAGLKHGRVGLGHVESYRPVIRPGIRRCTA